MVMNIFCFFELWLFVWVVVVLLVLVGVSCVVEVFDVVLFCIVVSVICYVVLLVDVLVVIIVVDVEVIVECGIDNLLWVLCVELGVSVFGCFIGGCKLLFLCGMDLCYVLVLVDG